MTQGWIKVHRKILESDFFKNLTGRQRDVIITLLLMANHESSEWEYKGKIYKTKPGQVFTSIEKIRQRCGKDCTREVVRQTLLNAERKHFITQDTHRTHTVITIENWKKYQDSYTEDTQIEHSLDTEHTQFTPTNKNIRNKEYKNKRNIYKGFSTKLLTEVFGEDKELEEALRAFKEMRTKIKKPLTDRAGGMISKKLIELSNGDKDIAIKILDQSILNGWQGIFRLKEGVDDGRGRLNGVDRKNEKAEQEGKWESYGSFYKNV